MDAGSYSSRVIRVIAHFETSSWTLDGLKPGPLQKIGTEATEIVRGDEDVNITASAWSLGFFRGLVQKEMPRKDLQSRYVSIPKYNIFLYAM